MHLGSFLIFFFLFLFCYSKESLKFKNSKKIIAIANGVEIPYEEFEIELKNKRFGGAKELILDELINLAIAVSEMRNLEGKTSRGEKTIKELGEAFLDKLFNEATVCTNIDKSEFENFLKRSKQRIFRLSIETPPPDLIEYAKEYYCRVQLKKIKRQYLKDLRQNAKVEIFLPSNNK